MKRIRTLRLFIYIAVFLTIIVIGVGGLAAYWSLDHRDILDVKNQPVPVNQITSPTGQGVIILKVDYCKYIKVNGKIRVSFVSSTREIFLPIADEKQPPVCQIIDFPIIIPSDAPPDTYHIHFRAVYNVNPIRQGVVEEFDSMNFKVQGVGPNNQSLGSM